MTQKKGPAQTGPQSERCRSVKGYEQRKSKGAHNCKVEFYPFGVATVAPHVGNPTGKGCTDRSEISSWSMSSRRRMREFLLTHRLPENMVGFNCTFTIPGPPLPVEKMNQLKNTWQIYLRRAGGCCVWRAEVQKRGSLHYHLFAGLPLIEHPLVPPDMIRKYTGLKGRDILKNVWMRSLSSLGPVEWWILNQWKGSEKIPPVTDGCCRLELQEAVTGEPVFLDVTSERPASMMGVSRFNGPDCPTDLSKWFGADKYATDIRPVEDTYGAWARYMNDHVSKAKQEQIGENIGRHWGKINAGCFEVVQPSSVARMTHRQYAAFLRCYHRLCTPFLRCPGALFGKRRGYTPTRGRTGRAVSFSNPETLRRLADWAMSE